MKTTLYLAAALCVVNHIFCQTIQLSPPVEAKDPDYRIIGKYKQETLVYNAEFRTDGKNKHQLYVYDSSMNLVQQSTIPLPLKSYSLKFVMYKDFFYVFFQRQEALTVYLMAEKIGADGKMQGEPVVLDKTAGVDYWALNKIYSVAISENKKYITAFKINNAEAINTTVTTMLFDDNLNLLHRSELYAPLEDGITFFSEFNMDDEGNFVFLRDCKLQNTSKAAKKAGIVIKQALTDSVYFINFLPADIYVKDVRITIDNLNRRYMATTFYSSTSKRNIDGMYCFVLNAQTHEPMYIKKITLEETLKKEVWARGTLKEAFNTFVITNMHVRKDGGFILDAGSYNGIETAGRWHNTYVNNTYKLPSGYLFYDDTPNDWYDSYTGTGNYKQTSIADNIVIFSFDSTASPEWIKVLHSSQLGDPNSVCFLTAEMGDKLYYVHNETAKSNNFLTTQVLNQDGEFGHDLLFKDMDRMVAQKMVFMPALGLQVSDKEVIMPCRNGRYICFAKINY